MLTKKAVLHVFSVFIMIVAILVFESSSSVSANKYAQESKPDIKSVQKPDQCLGAGPETAYHPLTSKVRFVGTRSDKPIQQAKEDLRYASPEDVARGYLVKCGALFGVNDQATELVVMRQNKTEDGRSVIRFQQNYQGVPILGGELVVQLNSANDIILVHGDMLPPTKLNIQANIDASVAQRTALQMVADQYGMNVKALKVNAAQLRIYSPALIQSKTDPVKLVWQMEVTPVELAPIRELVLVDAHLGTVALNFNQVDTVINRLTYSANNVATRPGTLVCDETNPTCSGGDIDAVNAHVYSGDTYDFYFNNYGRDSIDDAGMSLVSTVHYGSDYCNAFWDGAQMTYGDGCFIVADDVVAHEMTHGVTSHESNLIYSYESGAINESFSDIWGEFVDLTNGKGNDSPAVRWLLGEDTSIGAIRNMKDPTTFGHPDRIDSPYYYEYGDVHTNSGVGNKAAYLITDGGTFNGYTITGIGITKAAQVYYEAQTNILTPSSNYYSLYNALYQACNNLIGTSGIIAADCTEVQKATLATEMDHYPPPPPPSNDDISTSEVIGSLPYTHTEEVRGATTAVDDPVIGCLSGQRFNSVWYQYTPVSSETLIIDTFGSNYDTVLAVWTGSPGSLVSAGCNDDAPGLQSQIVLTVTAGVSYYIEVASFGGSAGTLTLNVLSVPPPSNDDISAPEVIGSLPYTNSQSTTEATTSVDDPVIGCLSGQRFNSVWYQYTPISSETLIIDTFGSNYDTVLAVWTGSPGSLVSVGCNDDTSGTDSQVRVVVTAGVSYYIEAVSNGDSAGTLTLNVLSVHPPSNDDISAPEVIGSLPYTSTQDIRGATIAPNDPDFGCISISGQRFNSVWYQYTPISSETLVIDTFGSNYDTVLAVWTGSPGSLVSVGCNDDTSGAQSQVRLLVTTGVSYYIEVASFGGNGGVLTMHSRSTWVPTGAMAVARWSATETLLPNGKVLIAGGGNYTNSAELYDPATGLWTLTGSMITSHATATLLPNGKVLAVGGGIYNYDTQKYEALATAELYDPATGLWTPTSSMATARSGPAATLLSNGKVLVAGGSDANNVFFASAELYDPVTGIWTPTGSLTTARADAKAILLPNDKVLVVGGWCDGCATATAELYNPVTGIWTTTGSMATVRAAHSATLLPTGKVLVAGGWGSWTDAELYDPATGLWTVTGSMSYEHSYHPAILLSNGKVMVIGGSTTSVELYDPSTGRWASTRSLIAVRDSHTATLLNNGIVLVAGGWDGSSALASAELYYETCIITGNTEVSSATLNYTDGIVKTADADGSGNYTIRVPYGWSGMVTPYKTGYTFTPVSKSYSNVQSSQTSQNYIATACVSCADVSVTIGGNSVGSYTLGSGGLVYPRYGMNGGPVHVVSTNAKPIFTSQRAIYGNSFNSIVGYPGNQLTTEYWFTSLDDLGMITYLVIGNPSTTLTAHVDVSIGGLLKGSYSIAPGQRVFPRYGINGGPVHVVSDIPIFTSERTKYGNSFNEVLGYPANQLTTDYWFTSLDDLGMITYLVIGNPSTTQTAIVNVYIGGNKMNLTPYLIAPGQRVYTRYGINGGPVHVVSMNRVPVYTSERTKYGHSFNEVLGYPGNKLATEYWFTSLDDAGMITYLVIGNPSTTLTAHVDVYINGVRINTTPYAIAPGQRVFPRYGVNSGTVRVVSDIPIFTSERSKYQSSFNEILGLPTDQLTTDYWFTSLDDLGMVTELVVAAP